MTASTVFEIDADLAGEATVVIVNAGRTIRSVASRPPAETPRLDSRRAVTSDELLPIAGLVAALGVALLLVERGAVLRLAGIAAAVAGAMPLINAQAPASPTRSTVRRCSSSPPALAGWGRSFSAPPSRCAGPGWCRSRVS